MGFEGAGNIIEAQFVLQPMGFEGSFQLPHCFKSSVELMKQLRNKIMITVRVRSP